MHYCTHAACAWNHINEQRILRTSFRSNQILLHLLLHILLNVRIDHCNCVSLCVSVCAQVYGVFYATSFLDFYLSPRQVRTPSVGLTVTVDSDEQFLFLVSLSSVLKHASLKEHSRISHVCFTCLSTCRF